MSSLKNSPKVVHFDGALVVGLVDIFRPMDPAIPALWEKFLARQPELDAQFCGPRSFGVCLKAGESGDGEARIRYCAGQEWLATPAEVPPGFELNHLEPGSYAVFTHRGPISRIDETIKHVWGSWAKTTELKLRNAPDFELYDERFCGEDPTSELDIYVPVHES